MGLYHGTLSQNSDEKVPTQAAVKSYVDTSLSGLSSVSGDFTVTGNLTVSGTTTTINTTTLDVEDKNIVVAKGAVDNNAASGGGITVESGDGNKSFTWNASGVQNYWQVAGGQLYAAEGLNAYGMLSEQVKVLSNDLGSVPEIYVSEGMVHYRDANLGTDIRPDIRYSSTRTLNNTMSNGRHTVTIIHLVSNSDNNVSGLEIDGTIQSVNWIGGSPPSDGGSTGVDIYTFNIIKTAANTYTVIGNQTKTS